MECFNLPCILKYVQLHELKNKYVVSSWYQQLSGLRFIKKKKKKKKKKGFKNLIKIKNQKSKDNVQNNITNKIDRSIVLSKVHQFYWYQKKNNNNIMKWILSELADFWYRIKIVENHGKKKKNCFLMSGLS